jgi:hypothetical protein
VSSESSEEDFGEDEQSECLEIRYFVGSGEESRHQPVPEVHDHISQSKEAADKEDAEKDAFGYKFTFHGVEFF